MNRPENRDPKPPMSQSGEARIDAALQAKPSVEIPAGFEARIAALAVAKGHRRRRSIPQTGRNTALFLTPVIAAALFLLAPHASPSLRNLVFDTEVILIAQLALIGWWVVRMPSVRLPRW